MRPTGDAREEMRALRYRLIHGIFAPDTHDRAMCSHFTRTCSHAVGRSNSYTESRITNRETRNIYTHTLTHSHAISLKIHRYLVAINQLQHRLQEKEKMVDRYVSDYLSLSMGLHI